MLNKNPHYLTWPTSGFLAKILELIINSKKIRHILRFFSPKIPILISDIKDVIYINWLVPADRLKALLPSPLELDVIEGKA